MGRVGPAGGYGYKWGDLTRPLGFPLCNAIRARSLKSHQRGHGMFHLVTERNATLVAAPRRFHLLKLVKMTS